jgi:hypothetical protein
MYEMTKEFLLPLLGPTVAIIVPVVVFSILPRARDRRKTALDLFTAYTADDMRTSRNEVWAYFVSEVAGNPQEQNKRLDQYLDYLTEMRWSTVHAPETMAVFQKASRVLDYFVFVEACLRHGMANESLIRCFMAHFYLWWREALVVPLRQRRQIDTCNPRCVPLWWHPLSHLDRLTGAPACPSVLPEPPVQPALAVAQSFLSGARATDILARSDATARPAGEPHSDVPF